MAIRARQVPASAGGEGDIYETVLKAMAHLIPGRDTIEFQALSAAVDEILSESRRMGHEVTLALETMAQIATTDESSARVIDWDAEKQQLHVTDPFFAFYLKWGVKPMGRRIALR